MANRRIEQLKAIPLFKGPEPRDLEFLSTEMDEINIRPGVLIRQGEPNDTFHILLSGHVEASVDGGEPRGLLPGEMFGEISMDAGIPATATVTATERVTVLVAGHRQFQDIEGNPRVKSEILKSIVSRVVRP